MRAVERLKFAIEFSQANLTRLRPGDRLNLKDDLSKFLLAEQGMSATLRDTGNAAPMVSEPPRPEDFNDSDFRGLQTEVANILAGIAQPTGRRAGVRTGMLKPVELRTLKLTAFPLGSSSQPAIVASGSTRDVFLFVLFLLLSSEGIENIAACRRCGRMFWRHDPRQKFCLRKCATQAAVSAFRMRKKKAAIRRKRHKKTRRRSK